MLATRTRLVAATTALTALSALTGCLDRDLQPLAPCTQSGVVERVVVDKVEKVDLLFMVDNSNSMLEEQAALAREIPRLITVLATGDVDGDGTPEFTPPKSLQVGTITSDMGTNPYNGYCSLNGDDGVLRTEGNVSIPGCVAAYSKFLSFEPGIDDPALFASSVACVAVTGAAGCGFEQQLEAMLKAVTPPNASPNGSFDGTFLSGSGHAGTGGANDGFVRPDSLLAIIALTDEEDCSAQDARIFDSAATATYGDPNTRCFNYGTDPMLTAPSVLHDPQRYVDGFLATRLSKSLFIFAAIVGVPVDVVPGPDQPTNYDAILNDPRMKEQLNPNYKDPVLDPEGKKPLIPSCDTASGLAFPPRRFVEVAKGLNEQTAGGIIQSICQSDFRPALDAIIKKFADVIGGTCLPRELSPDENGFVSCDVIETLPPAKNCSDLPGRVEIGRTTEGAAICKVTQLPSAGAVPAGDGWYYDNFSGDVLMRCGETATDGQRISYTDNAQPMTGTDVKLECLQPVQSSTGGDEKDVGVPCNPPADTTCEAGGYNCLVPRLICDPDERVWRQTCENDSQCPGGFRCNNVRPAGLPAVCVNPTC